MEDTIYDCCLGAVVPISEASDEGIHKFLAETCDDDYITHNLILGCIIELEKREKKCLTNSKTCGIIKIQKGKELITMMKILIDRLDYCVRACERMNERVARKCFYDQAFGAVQYHIILFPSDTAEVESLWNDYRVRFEEIVYGVL